MRLIMKRAPLFRSIDQVKDFLKTSKASGLAVEIIASRDKYEFIKTTFWNLGYHRLSRKEKHFVLGYLKFFTGYSKSHLKRLALKTRTGTLHFNPARKRNKFSRKYFPSDIALLIETDYLHEALCGEATRTILWRQYNLFGKNEYATISKISRTHIYNLRNNNQRYNSSKAKFYKRTKASTVDIGIRRKPEPNGKPGYLRVNTVHQGDFNGLKGVYHVNLVDEVTQYEIIATVPKITEKYLRPVVKELLKLFPFVIHEFHPDNGSEFINHLTARMLNKIHIELSKSRSRHSNDNALVESKNGSVVRKIYGKNYIGAKWAKQIDKFNRKFVNIYLNYHRPCAFAENKIDSKGKIRKKYNQWMVPYEKLKSLENAEQYLKPGFSFAELDKIAYEKSDNDFAEEMQKAKRKLFRIISSKN